MSTRATAQSRKHRRLRPARLLAVSFAGVITAGALLLWIPAAREGSEGAPFLVAFFQSVSAVTVTGLTTVDTGAYWSLYGELVTLALIKVGGLGIMTLTSMVILALGRRLATGNRLLLQLESRVPSLSNPRRLLLVALGVSLTVESITAAVLTLRLWVGHDYALDSAIYRGVFHAVSAFNNAGFSLWDDSLAEFVTDGWVVVPVALAVIVGGIGLPALLELRYAGHTPRRWSLHTKLTLGVTALLVVVGTAAVLGFESGNAATLGPLSTPGKLLAAFFQGITPRTAGFATIDYGAARSETLLISDFLMFVGGGSASTAGGIKVTTLFLVVAVVWTEARGDTEVQMFERRVPHGIVRQALAVTIAALAVVAGATLALIASSDQDVSVALFEAVSAFGTVGLSTGATSEWNTIGLATLMVLMFVGRIGPQALGTALAMRERPRAVRYAEERPIVG